MELLVYQVDFSNSTALVQLYNEQKKIATECRNISSFYKH